MLRPDRGVGQGTFSMPLGGGSVSGLWYDALFLIGNLSMAAQPTTDADGAASDSLPPLPCDVRTWDAIANTLELSAQQKRIVELLLSGCRDKQIATELNLTVPTVRTYLKRIFDRVGAPDRLGLVLRIFAMAQEQSQPRRSHRSR